MDLFKINHIAIGLLSMILLLAIVACDDTNSHQPIIPTEKLMQGDIAFRKGEGFVSDVVLYNDADGLYSHIGLIVIHNDSIKVVHSVPGEGDYDGVKIEPIEMFYATSRAVKGEVLRMELNDEQRRVIGEIAIKKGIDKIEFDHDYNLNDTTQVYCTELIKLLFNRIGINIVEGRSTRVNIPGMSGDYIMPSDVYRNKKLISIYKY
ncbi:MAG: hypothetical protein IJE73_01980 [Muribaculaceae bacterium]|nr:hypothetical protein [Muribaculaceae bacterium]